MRIRYWSSDVCSSDLGTYLGYANARRFASNPGLQRNVATVYQPPPKLAVNHWSFVGSWNVGSEFATPADDPGAIDRKRVMQRMSASVRIDHGGRRNRKKYKLQQHT